MEEGVAYMMMGEGGDSVQPTQLVALQSEDGTQQLAVPVIDPNTGQETYMILDQNALEGEDGQQLLIVGDGEGAQLVQGDAGLGQGVGGEDDFTLGEDQNGGVLIVPSTISTSLSSSTESASMVYVSPDTMQTAVSDLSMEENLSPGPGLNVPEKEGGMIHVVGVKEDKQIKQQNRQPRKQHLAATTDFSQEEARIATKPQSVDSYMAKSRVSEPSVRAKYRARGAGVVRGRGRPRKNASLKPKVIKCDQCQLEFPANVDEARLIDHVQRFHMKKDPPKVAKSYLDPDMPIGPQCYKCSDCNESFLQIRTLLDHQKEAHSRETEVKKSISTPSLPTPTQTIKVTSVTPSVTSLTAPVTSVTTTPLTSNLSQSKLEYEETPTKLDYPDSPSKQKVEVIKKLADEWDDEDDGDGQGQETLNEEIPREILGAEAAASLQSLAADSSANHSLSAANELPSLPASTDINGGINGITKIGGLADRLKGDEDEEEKIVADVDDILSETDRLVSCVDSLLTQKAQKHKTEIIPTGSDLIDSQSQVLKSPRKRPAPEPPKDVDGDDMSEDLSSPALKKKPSVQCEECYECFEDEEKLAWHNLNDH